MEMNKKLEQIKNKKISLMGHIVGGYPDVESSLKAAKGICRHADFIEVQFPFSDPSADGKVIEGASYKAIDAGFTVEDGFKIVKELSETTEAVVIIMTYANIVYKYGIERFVKKAKENGANAFIVPDLPYGSDEGLSETAEKYGIGVIQVISPGVGDDRIKMLGDKSYGVLYVTARRGITGGKTDIGAETEEWIATVKRNCSKPIALGFGIKSNSQVRALAGKTEIVVAGSYFVEKITSLSKGSDFEGELAKAAQELLS